MRSIKVAVIFVFIFLSGCSFFSPVKTPTNTYLLNKIPCVSSQKMRYSSLLVTMPTTSSIYSTTQIAYSKHPYQITYFANNVWAATPTEMLQSAMVQTLQNTHAFRSISSSNTLEHYDVILNTQLVKLQQNFCAQGSEVMLVMRAQLVNASTARVIRAKEFTMTEPAPLCSPYGGVVAANRATESFLRQLTYFVTR